MTIKAILTTPYHFFKVAYKHIKKGPPRSTWTFPFHVMVNTLSRLMIANKDNISSARMFTEVAMPTDWNVKIKQTVIPKRSDINVENVQDPKDRIGYLQAEWVLHKPTIKKLEKEWKESRPDLSKNQLKQQVNPKEKIVLYFHGGAYIVCSPKTHRFLTWRLSKYGASRVLAVYYTKAPEAVWPGAIHDAVSAYLHLIAPANGGPAYDPSQIVLAGDSAGGNLCFSLLLWLKQNNYPLPAGVVAFSPWIDLTHSQPSYIINAPYDYVPAEPKDPKYFPRVSNIPKVFSEKPQTPEQAMSMDPPDSAITMDDLPKNLSAEEIEMVNELDMMMHTRQYYAPDELLTHPLVSPVFGDAVIWREIIAQCPVLIQSGEAERLRDEGLVFMGKILGAVTSVRDHLGGHNAFLPDSEVPNHTISKRVVDNLSVELYQDCPHVVPLFFVADKRGKVCMKRAGEFIHRVTSGGKNSKVEQDPAPIMIPLQEALTNTSLHAHIGRKGVVSPFSAEQILALVKDGEKKLSGLEHTVEVAHHHHEFHR